MAPATSGTKPRKAMDIFAAEFKATELERMKSSGQEVSISDFSKISAEKWRELTKEEKQKYTKLAKKEKGEVEPKKTSSRKAKEDKENKPKKKKATKDPNAPKRPASSYFLFCSDNRSSAKEETPGAGITDIAKVLGIRWKALTDEQKKIYQDRADVDKKRYEKEMEAYKKSQKKAEEDDAEAEEEFSDD